MSNFDELLKSLDVKNYQQFLILDHTKVHEHIEAIETCIVDNTFTQNVDLRIDGLLFNMSIVNAAHPDTTTRVTSFTKGFDYSKLLTPIEEYPQSNFNPSELGWDTISKLVKERTVELDSLSVDLNKNIKVTGDLNIKEITFPFIGDEYTSHVEYLLKLEEYLFHDKVEPPYNIKITKDKTVVFNLK